MPSNTVCKSRSSAIPAVRQAQKRCSAHDYVRHYTEMLVIGTRQIHALHKLREIDCPIRVFEDCLTEQVIRKNNFELYQYMADDLLRKFDAMRRKENIQAQQRLAKNGEHTAHVSFKPEFVELQKMIIEQRKESETNQLFANAMSKTKGSSSTVPRVKPDYSKFKIVKRSKASSSSSSSPSSSSSTSSPNQ
ncbi:Protein CBG21012 [Caenorhabditis briggsae]|uniref:Protein CBG21012 n=2 Tax=Caenorhabditis briggsae TaxID=6238 RepID=A8XZ60_CAEBR|nr:Protein CBG21012 [Caenorhabditis briggsae]ULU07571.1 hypothetical protein L3Y34_018941 [Caenorhabditis briggsae]CAP37927.1 Protein CBG21012 [Caenorhabditis briggsae]